MSYSRTLIMCPKIHKKRGVYLLQSWHSRWMLLLAKLVHMLRSQAKFGGCANSNSARCWCWAMRCLFSILISLPPRPTAGLVCARPKPLLLQHPNTWGALVAWCIILITLHERKLAADINNKMAWNICQETGEFEQLSKNHSLIRSTSNVIEANGYKRI